MKKDNDYLYQFEYVIENIWRLIHLQDNNPFSDTFGCMDYKFWRDKSVDFADARYQEASATIGILCSKNFFFNIVWNSMCRVPPSRNLVRSPLENPSEAWNARTKK